MLTVLAVLLVLVIVLAALSRLVYHRSIAATICEFGVSFIKDRKSEAESIAYLTARAAEEEPVYVFQENLKSPVSVSAYLNLKIYTLNKNDSSPIVIYTHGGAYTGEISGSHWSMLDKIAQKSGCELHSIIYPLAPWHTWEESYDSITAYYGMLRETYPDRAIYLSGDSAGGGLALGISVFCTEQGLPAPDGLILLSPWVEASETNPDILPYERIDPMLSAGPLRAAAMAWAGDEPVEDWHISPLNADLEALKNVHIFVGDREMFYPDDILLYEKLLACGVDSRLYVGRGMNHIFPAYPIPEADRAIEQIAGILTGETHEASGF